MMAGSSSFSDTNHNNTDPFGIDGMQSDGHRVCKNRKRKKKNEITKLDLYGRAATTAYTPPLHASNEFLIQ